MSWRGSFTFYNLSSSIFLLFSLKFPSYFKSLDFSHSKSQLLLLIVFFCNSKSFHFNGYLPGRGNPFNGCQQWRWLRQIPQSPRFRIQLLHLRHRLDRRPDRAVFRRRSSSVISRTVPRRNHCSAACQIYFTPIGLSDFSP